MLFFSIMIYSQENQTIVYDFAKGEYEKSEIKPKYGKPIVFKIININRLYYAPTIEGISDEIVDQTIGLRVPASSPATNVPAPTNTTESADKELKADSKKSLIPEVKIKGLSEGLSEVKNLENKITFNNQEFTFTEKTANTLDQLYRYYKDKLNS